MGKTFKDRRDLDQLDRWNGLSPRVREQRIQNVLCYMRGEHCIDHQQAAEDAIAIAKNVSREG